MSLLLLQSASWTKPKAKSRNWPMIRNPRAATPCHSAAKISKCDSDAADALRVRFFAYFEAR